MHKKSSSDIRIRSSNASGTGWLMQILASLLALASEVLIFTELTGYGQGIILAITGAYLCIVYGLLIKFQKQGWFFPVVLLIMLAICLIFPKPLLAGYCNFYSQLSDTITLQIGWILPELEPPEMDKNTAIVLFSLMCGSTMGLISCCFTPGVLAVCLPGVAIVGMFLLGCTTSPGWLLPVLVISLLLLLCSRRDSQAFVPVLCGWSGCALIFCILLLCLSGLKDWGNEIGSRVQQVLHRCRYETECTVLPEGNLAGTPTENEEIQPGLVVTMSGGEKMYLRGFAGCTFADSVWTPVSAQALYQEKELLYWLNRNAFSLNAQFETASVQLGLEIATVTVENIGGCSENLYVPYNLCNGDYLTAENLNPDVVAGQGSRSYSYSVVTGGSEAISQVLDSLQTGDDAWIHQYRQAESAYRSFVYDNYLSVPEDVETLLLESWNAVGEKYGDSPTLEQAQSCVLEYLESHPDDLLPDWAGSSYQYATLAVLTARHFGIPARYAEGYVISEEMAESNVAIGVDSSCAGAWAEVYQDGIGWIPMDLLPGTEGEASQKQPEPSSTPEDREETPQDTPTGQSPLDGRAFAPVRYSLLVLPLLIFLLLVCRRQYRRRKVMQKFRMEDAKEAVGWIFADTAMLLEELGLHRHNGSMGTLVKPAGECFGEEYEMALTECIRLNDLSLFSSRELTDAHRQTQLAFRQETLKQLHKKTKWHRRFWLKWLRCLY